jgi:hypothetical protein
MGARMINNNVVDGEESLIVSEYLSRICLKGMREPGLRNKNITRSLYNTK